MEGRPKNRSESCGSESNSRREFLKLSAMTAAVAAAGSSRVTKALVPPSSRVPGVGRGNGMPGRIVLHHDTLMEGHEPTINRDRVELAVHRGVRTLTGITDTGAAFESLFPGLSSASTIAIKVNCLAWNDTRWEVVRGVVSGLSLMLDGTYDVGQVTIHDVQTNLSNHGYVAGEFTFNGGTPLITDSEDCSPYVIYGTHRLSNHVLNSDYVINVPVLKAHNTGYPQHLITTAFKNHYGSICPQSLCNNTTGMLSVNADSNIKDKTCLVLTSALRGTYNGDPWGTPQLWNVFPEQSPNMLFVTTDPVTEAYWALETINAERVNRGLTEFVCPWIEEASHAPYSLGISDPGQMEVIESDAADVSREPEPHSGEIYLAPNVPNPFSEQTGIRFRLAQPGRVVLLIVDPSGRTLRRVTEREFPAGHTEVRWDGRDDRGRPVPTGAYFARLETVHAVRSRQVLVVR